MSNCIRLLMMSMTSNGQGREVWVKASKVRLVFTQVREEIRFKLPDLLSKPKSQTDSLKLGENGDIWLKKPSFFSLQCHYFYFSLFLQTRHNFQWPKLKMSTSLGNLLTMATLCVTSPSTTLHPLWSGSRSWRIPMLSTDADQPATHGAESHFSNPFRTWSFQPHPKG